MARPTARDGAPIEVSLRERFRYRFDDVGWRHTADGSVVLNAEAAASVTLTGHDELVVVG